MDNTATNLTIANLQGQISLLEQQVAELTARLDWYERQSRLAMQRRYGPSSERTAPEKRQLFNKAEAEAKPSLPEPTVETITYQGRLERSKTVLDEFLAWLDEQSLKTVPKRALGHAIAYCHA